MTGLTEKDDYLRESYRERERGKEDFTADLSKYDEKQRKTIQNAIDSGILNNKRSTHKVIDWIAKIAGEKGIDVDFANNERLKESGLAISDGQIINGFVKDGKVTYNLESAKVTEAVIGHEIAHVFEGTELYDELSDMVTKYTTANGTYESTIKALKKTYRTMYDETSADFDSKIQKEFVADFIGDTLFTDENFIAKLSEKPTLFSKVYDEIKYLAKSSKGTEAEKQLLDLQRKFEKMYRGTEANKGSGTKYSLSVPDGHIKLFENEKILDNYHVPKEFKYAIIEETDFVTEDEFAVARQEVFKKATKARKEGNSLSFRSSVYSANHIFWYDNYSETDFHVTKVVNIENSYKNKIKEKYNESIDGRYGRELSRRNERIRDGYRRSDDSGSYAGYRETSTTDARLPQNGTTNGRSASVLQDGRNTGIEDGIPIRQDIKASDNDVFFDGSNDIQLSLSNQNTAPLISLSETPLQDRVSGDALLDAEDLIAEIENVAEVSPNGYVTLYHRTTKERARKIMKSGKMSAKEDGVFFGTKSDGDNLVGYGDAVIKLKVPVEKLVLDDIFSDEAHLKIPLKNRNEILDVSAYLDNPDIQPSLSNQNTTPLNGTNGRDLMLNKASLPDDLPIRQDITPKNVQQSMVPAKANTATSQDGIPIRESAKQQSTSSLSKVIDLSKDNELAKKVSGMYGSKKYKTIQKYILDTLGEQPIRLSDGKHAIVDRSDALHIANKTAPRKTAQIERIKELVEKAEIYAEDKHVEHNKFDYFCYYKTDVKFGEDVFSIYLNIGRGKNDGQYHLYDITNKIKDTADRINGLERPKPNEGYAQRNGIFDLNIPHFSENATEIRENSTNAKSTLTEIDEEWKKNQPSEVDTDDDLIENKTLERILLNDTPKMVHRSTQEKPAK